MTRASLLHYTDGARLLMFTKKQNEKGTAYEINGKIHETFSSPQVKRKLARPGCGKIILKLI
jgi:hypothetical protein